MINNSKVTIGIPTYKRPKLLLRALTSIVVQDYKNIEVIVGDNNSESNEVEDIIKTFQNQFTSLIYKKHDANLGSTENMLYLLRKSTGIYFMWLADDDELMGESYISTLVNLLDENHNMMTAVALWKKMDNEESGTVQTYRDYSSNYWLARVVKFVWKSNDDFFYGLHRKALLKQARLGSYWKINKEEVSNLTYTFLIDLVIMGQIVRSNESKIAWVCHAYTDKFHSPKKSGRRVDLKYIARRINIYYIYVHKIYEKGGLISAFVLIIVSVSALLREILAIVYKYFKIRLERL
jgi:glycosyltransferase involved in cell wall biosynthesis